jgi:hypothetical protein
MCHFEMYITIAMTAAASQVNIAIADWDILKLENGTSEACNVHCVKNGSTNITKAALISENALTVTFDSSTSISDSIVIRASGSFQIQ